MTAERVFLDHLSVLGVPIFTAPPGGDDSEYVRPNRWQETPPTGNASRIASHRPGHALAGVMGGNVAVLDVDTKNGADPDKVLEMVDGIRVRVYADLVTPSGGRHLLAPR